MARFEIGSAEHAFIGSQAMTSDVLFQLGIDHSIGRRVPADMVTAHMWFNLAAQQGNRDAIRLRREISQEMTATDIAEAQRRAREWLMRH
jgi:TPR repeat protein